MAGNGNLFDYLISQQSARHAAKLAPLKPKAPSRPVKGSSFYNPAEHGKLPIHTEAHHSGGGFLHGITSIPHEAAHYADQAAHDIAAMPAGIAQLGAAAGHDAAKFNTQYVLHPLHLGTSEYDKKAAASHYELPGELKAMAKGSYESVRHPLRDPFQAALTVGAVASAGLGAGLRVAGAADAARAGDLAEAGRALVRRPVMPERLVNVPKVVKTKKGDLKFDDETVQFVHSHRPIARAAQELHDKIVQRALNKTDFTEKPSLAYKYAASRIGKATSETARRSERVRLAPAQALDDVHRFLLKKRTFGKNISLEEGHLALFLRSNNILGHEARDFWAQASDFAEHPNATMRLAEISHQLEQKGVLKVSRGKVEINGKLYPHLKHVDDLVKDAQGIREGIIKRHGLMTPEAMKERLSLVAEIMKSEAARNAETGVREGQGFTPLSLSEKELARYPRSGSVPVTGGIKNFISKTKHATGEGVRQGLIPDDTVAGIARALRQALGYQAKFEHRGLVAKYGSQLRRTGEDVLLAKPGATLGKITSRTRQELGQEKATVNALREDPEEQQLHETINQHFEDAVPHLVEGHPYGSKFQSSQGVGAEAPKGYVWVHKNMMGDLAKSVAPRGKFARRADAINAYVTAATVYFKLSHIPQRAITDATTSAVSGALFSPKSLRMYAELKDALTPKQLQEAAQATGTHGYSALPHEGETVGAKVATKGANFYARHIDARFRLLNLVHEARKAGINNPTEFKKLLSWAKNPTRNVADKTKYEHVLARSDRVSMMYDGLTADERRTIARGLWFYPWTKAAARYGGHTIAEHPVVSGAGANFGAQGRQRQASILGDLPSFEYGLVPLSGHKTSAPGWLWPFNTAADVAELGARPQQIIGNLNPVYQAGLTAVSGLNNQGETQGHPIGTALSELAAPTPEFRTLHDYLHAKAAERKTRMFPHSPTQDLWTSLVFGPWFPKKTNKKALHFASKKERGLFTDILIPRK